MNQLISEELLKKSNKILFIAHLALGDFTYMQSYFKALADAYPHLKIDLWIDESRRKKNLRGKNLASKTLFDWVRSCSFFSTVYHTTFSPEGFAKAKTAVLQQEYSIVISLGTLRPHRYADLARSLSPQGFVIGMGAATKPWQFLRKRSFGKLDAALNSEAQSDAGVVHINKVYAQWFEHLFGSAVGGAARPPFVAIPAKWQEYSDKKLSEYSVGTNKLVFINSFAKERKRCWTNEQIIDTIKELRSVYSPQNITFLVNSLPSTFDEIKQTVDKEMLKDVFVFSATESFFQLPSIIAECDLVISVETSIMHFAAALKVPVVALMRQKNPEWVPWGDKDIHVITAQNRTDWIKEISVDRVVREVKTLW